MPDRPLLLGHRGARATRSVPENTVASFDLALQHGCDGFEFDVRCTRDGTAIVCHDSEVEKIEIAGAIRSELPQLALLEDVAERYRERAFLDIELKVPGLEDKVIAALERHIPERGFVVSSFFAEVLLELRSRNASIPLGLIADRRHELVRWKDLPVQWVIPHYRLTTKELIGEIHSAGKKAGVWTVNEPEAMRRFADWGADAIISDNTQLLVATLNNREVGSGSRASEP